MLENNPQLSAIIAGDFNARIGDISGDSTTNTRGRKLLRFLSGSTMQVHRFKEGSATSFGYRSNNGKTRSIPDLILSYNCEPEDVQALMTESCGGSDHCPVIWKLKLPITANPKMFTRLNFRNLEEPETRRKLKELLHYTSPIALIQEQDDIDKCWCVIRQWITSAAEQTVKRFTFNSNNQKQFWVEPVVKAARALSKETQKYRSTQNTPHSGITKKQKEFQKVAFQRKQQIFDKMTKNLSQSENIHGLYRMITGTRNRLTGTRCGLLTKDMEKHRIHFASTFGQPPMNDDEDGYQLPLPIVETDIFTTEEVSKTIQSMARGKAPGPDGIPADLLLESETVVQVYTSLLNKCYKQLRIPTEWKEANIIPVFKKGNKLEAKNYRPIALCCTSRRIYEKLIAKSLNHYQLSNQQGGFRPKRSTIHQIWTLHNTLQKHKNLHTCLLDLKAAYDTVNRGKLYQKLLHKYQIPINTIYRIRDLFEGVHSQIILKGQHSEKIAHKRGLLQGSSLSPILFNYFIDDLLSGLHTNYPRITTHNCGLNSLGFADDICILSKTKKGLQVMIDYCADWSNQNELEFSPEKCVLLQPDENIRMYNSNLKSSQRAEYLGIVFKRNGIDKTETLKSRLSKGVATGNLLASIGMHGLGFSQESSGKLYKQFIRPKVEYGLQVIDLTKTNRTKLNQFQNQVFRRIFSAPRNTSRNAMHKLLQIIPLSNRADQLHAKFHFQLLKANDTSIPAFNMATEMKNKNLWPTNDWSEWVATKSLSSKKSWQVLTTLDPPNIKSVSNSVVLASKRENIHHALTAEAFMCQRTRKTILTWLIGGVAKHQNCNNCGEFKGLSREHALSCSNANIYLHQTFKDESKEYLTNEIGNTPIKLNFLDFLLHRHRAIPDELEHQWNFYNKLSYTIGMVYKKCLNYSIDEEGFWRKPDQFITILPLTVQNSVGHNQFCAPTEPP
jgi:hypothetical protein